MLLTIFVAALVVFAVSQMSTFATTIYLHRSMAHKGLKLHPIAAAFARIELWLFTGIVVREWVAVHRKHHHFTDQEGDPHSPVLKGVWNVLFWNAIYYAREASNPAMVAKYTRDMPYTLAERLLFKRGWLGLATGMTLFVAGFALLIPGWVGASIGALAFIAQGLFYIGLNAVINGAGHAWGYKNFANTATNMRIFAWLSAGEGLHNNHHQFPASAKLSFKKWEFDPAWPVIKLLEKMKLAKPLPLPKLPHFPELAPEPQQA